MCPAPKGNRNAAKEKTKDSFLHIRIERELLNEATEHARGDLGITLSAYVVRLLKSDLGLE